MWLSISRIFSTLSLSSNGDWVRFSTARTTPPFVQIPTVVEPSCEGGGAAGQLGEWEPQRTLGLRPKWICLP